MGTGGWGQWGGGQGGWGFGLGVRVEDSSYVISMGWGQWQGRQGAVGTVQRWE